MRQAEQQKGARLKFPRAEGIIPALMQLRSVRGVGLDRKEFPPPWDVERVSENDERKRKKGDASTGDEMKQGCPGSWTTWQKMGREKSRLPAPKFLQF